METDTLVGHLPALRLELAEWRKREAEAKSRAEGLEQIIAGIERFAGMRKQEAPHAEPLPFEPEARPVAGNGDGPRGIGAVRRVMLEDFERVWRAREVHATMEDRGWISPGASHPLRGTEAAINRLLKRGELERLRPGRYRATEKMKEMAEQD